MSFQYSILTRYILFPNLIFALAVSEGLNYFFSILFEAKLILKFPVVEGRNSLLFLFIIEFVDNLFYSFFKFELFRFEFEFNIFHFFYFVR